MKRSIRIFGLLWADILVIFAWFLMQNYLTDVWEISLTHAAAIINIWNGLYKILPVFFLFLADAFLGHFMMLLISSVAYIVGISFVVMSTPPVLGHCKKYEKECIDDAQIVIFYIGMALIAAGRAGYAVSVRHFHKEQLEEADENTSNTVASDLKNESGKRLEKVDEYTSIDENTSNTSDYTSSTPEVQNELGKHREQPEEAEENTSSTAVSEVQNKLGKCKEQTGKAEENTSSTAASEVQSESGKCKEQLEEAEENTSSTATSEVQNELGKRKEQPEEADQNTSNSVPEEVQNESGNYMEHVEEAEEITSSTTMSEVQNESGNCIEQIEEAEGNTLSTATSEEKNELRKRKEQPERADKNTSISNCLKSVLPVLLIAIVAAIFLAYFKVKPWSIIFGIPAICTLVSTLLFFSGWPNYKKVEPNGSPITNICRVFVAFFHKRSLYRYGRYYRKGNQESFTRTRFLRFLEKAAIILRKDVSTDGQIRNRWKLCSVSEVEEAKIAVRMVPMWLTFIVCGMVSSIGNTYFIEQAKHMNRKIGNWNVPLLVLVLLIICIKPILEHIVKKCFLEKASALLNDKKCLPAIGIGIAMVFSILCCITAAKIETERLRVIRKHGLLDKPDEHIPMGVYWLLFQFCLLAGLDAFSEKCIAAFHTYQGPKSMKHYLGHFVNFVLGLGFMCSVLSVYVVGKISDRGGKTNWFQFTLSKSRLDRYYWFLAALSSVNLAVFVVVGSCYRYKDIEKDVEGVECDIHEYFENVWEGIGNLIPCSEEIKLEDLPEEVRNALQLSLENEGEDLPEELDVDTESEEGAPPEKEDVDTGMNDSNTIK